MVNEVCFAVIGEVVRTDRQVHSEFLIFKFVTMLNVELQGHMSCGARLRPVLGGSFVWVWDLEPHPLRSRRNDTAMCTPS